MTSLPWPELSDLEALGPALSSVAPPEAEDANGHVNITWYYKNHMHAIDAAVAPFGIDKNYIERTGHSVFSVEHHIKYHAEVLVGQKMSFYLRVLGMGSKIIHGMSILVNESTGQVANTLEFIDAHIDLSTRRTHPFSEETAERFDQIASAHANLAWELPLGGAMGVRQPQL